MAESRVALRIALTAIFTAIVAVFTIAVRIPTPTIGGYISLCDVAIAFTSFAFGPAIGFIAGGVGTALADLVGGYPQWAIVSFTVHGLEGLILGFIIRGGKPPLWRKIVAVIATALIVAGGYFLLTGLFLESFGVAALEAIPNLIQGAVGGALGLVLYEAVRKGYRNLDNLRL